MKLKTVRLTEWGHSNKGVLIPWRADEPTTVSENPSWLIPPFGRGQAMAQNLNQGRPLLRDRHLVLR